MTANMPNVLSSPLLQVRKPPLDKLKIVTFQPIWVRVGRKRTTEIFVFQTPVCRFPNYYNLFFLLLKII